jgi:hypothetical protein
MSNTIVSEIYSYHTNWKEGKVNQMWIEQITDKECDNLFVAVAHNPRNGSTMEMSNPRTSYHETLNWVRIGAALSVSFLPDYALQHSR